MHRASLLLLLATCAPPPLDLAGRLAQPGATAELCGTALDEVGFITLVRAVTAARVGADLRPRCLGRVLERVPPLLAGLYTDALLRALAEGAGRPGFAALFAAYRDRPPRHAGSAAQHARTAEALRARPGASGAAEALLFIEAELGLFGGR